MEDGGHNFDLPCPTILTVCYFFFPLLGCASFLNVTAIDVDRLLAITLYLLYQELVTLKRVIIALVSVWFTSVVTASLYLVKSQRALVVVIAEFVGILLTQVAYIHIYRVVRHHQNQIHSLLQRQNRQAMELFREKKSSFNAVYFLRNFCRMLSPPFQLWNIVDNGQRSKFCLVVYARYNFFRSS